jgi:hypothetical protein
LEVTFGEEEQDVPACQALDFIDNLNQVCQRSLEEIYLLISRRMSGASNGSSLKAQGY